VGDSSTSAQKSDSLQAVAIDTNSLGGGRLNLPVLRDWAHLLQSIGLEVWIPEPVAWELTEHATEEFIAARSSLRSSRRALLNAGFEVPDWPEYSRDDLLSGRISALEDSHANVRILHLDGDDAREALRDQILLRAPAVRKNPTEKKKGVKTGGSDIASVRALRRRDPSSTLYAILSQDSDWTAVYKSNDWAPPRIFAEWRELKAELFTSVSAAGATPAALAFLRGSFFDDAPSVLEPLMGAGQAGEGEVDDLGLYVRTSEIAQINSLAGLDSLEKYEETGDWTANVYFLADLDVTLQRYDPSNSSWSNEDASYSGALIRSSLTFHVKDDVVVGVTAGVDEPSQLVARRRYWEPEDAFEAALDALRDVPGLEEIDWPTAYEKTPASLTVRPLNGPEVTLELGGHVMEEWELDASVDGVLRATLGCSQDLTSWVGGSDGFFVEPPWEMMFDGGSVEHAEWQLSAELLSLVSIDQSAPIELHQTR